MTSHDNRRPGHEFGPHLSHQDAMRRLTALSSGCKSCTNDAQHRPADLDRARSQPMPKLRHYPMVQAGHHSPLQQESVGGMPISPPAKFLASPPTSPLVSFWGAFFDTTNSTTSVFAQNQKLGMPLLSISDM